MSLLSYEKILEAHERIKKYIHRTPVMSSQILNAITGSDVYFKCENLQKVGAFKARGGCNAIFLLNEEEASRGVIAHSSGNHGAAVAYAARKRGIPAVIVMPENSLACKFAAVESYGAEIVRCQPGMQNREAAQSALVSERGLVPIHPYNDLNVMAGQGTTALELLEQVPDLDILIVPVGGGGLLAGSAVVIQQNNRKIFGIEPELANSAFRSHQAKEHIKIDKSSTVADGLRAPIGDMNYQITKDLVDAFYCVSEDSIVPAQKWFMSRLKLVIEPSCAVPVAWLLTQPDEIKRKKVGVILTGGNMDI
jgi:threonine dehydratase